MGQGDAVLAGDSDIERQVDEIEQLEARRRNYKMKGRRGVRGFH